MSYYTDLTQDLRKRGCDDDQIRTVLETVRDTSAAEGTSPEVEFGAPEDLASRYEGPRKRSPGAKVLNGFGLVGLLCVIVYAIRPELFGFTVPVLKQFAGMIAMLILLIIGAFVAGFVDTRLPRGFSPEGADSGSPGSTSSGSDDR